MWRSKKFIIAAVVATVLLAGGIGGIALAADNGVGNQPKPPCGDLLARVCEIYQQKTGVAIDQEVLKEAFDQVRSDMQKQWQETHRKGSEWRPPAMPNRPEIGPEDMLSRLQKLVDEGRITQEQADQFKSWLQSKPNTEQFEQQLKDWQQERPEIPAELKAWLEARPDLPLRFGFPGGPPGPPGPGPCPPPE
jgi:hypothetical protein